MTSKSIAIIGLSGRFPDARNIEAFYQNLKSGTDSVRSVSLSRIRDTSLVLGKNYKDFGYLEDIDKFDFRFFNIPFGEAVCMAPQQRIMLESAYEAIEQAGYSPDSLAGSRTAVYMASNPLHYYKLADEFNPALLVGNQAAGISGRISRFFNFTGNSMHVDTACSSSLVALHLACQDLLTGEAEYALCGGINIILFPPVDGADKETGITSVGGKSRTFSEQADGAGMGEAAACLLLKPLDKALEDQDNILAIVNATAVNQDANRSSTLSAPSSIAQAEVIVSAWEKASIPPETISYIEAHGTGTALGDPIEIEGLSRAFRKFTSKRQFCAVSALKSNIGHCDSASGLAGVVKAVLSLQKKELFPSLHLEAPNPFIDFIDSPVYVNVKHQYWESLAEIRRAGVSSFGISGTNSHIVLEEAPAIPTSIQEKKPYFFCVSAQNFDALKQNCHELRTFLLQEQPPSLEQISYTLATGRKHHAYRHAFVADSREQLLKGLDPATLSATIVSSTLSEPWFLFVESEPVQAEGLIRQLIEEFPAFGKAYKHCTALLLDLSPKPTQSYAFDYSFYHFLKHLGFQVNQVMGLETGKDMLSTISGKYTIGDMPAIWQKRQAEKQRYIPPRWKDFVDIKLSGEQSSVIEIGVGTRYYAELLNYQHPGRPFEVFNPLEKKSFEGVLEWVAQSYIKGYTLHLEALFANRPRKVALPTYQFEKNRCWISEQVDKEADSWIYQMKWAPIKETEARSIENGHVHYVVYCDDRGIGEALALRLLQQDFKCIRVYHGALYQVKENGDIIFDWTQEPAYQEFKHYLLSRGLTQLVHLHLGACSVPVSSLEASLQQGLYAVLLQVKAFTSVEGKHSLVICTNTGVEVTGLEATINPEQGAIHGLVAGIKAEFPTLEVRCIDIEADLPPDYLRDQLLREIHTPGGQLVVGLREGNRYGRRFDKPLKQKGIILAQTAVYMITGGASGIGLQMLQALASCRATFIVLGRRQFPPKHFWKYLTPDSHPDLYEDIQGLLAAEHKGAKVVYFATDLSDRKKVEYIVRKVEKDYGSLRGIIHSAGIGGKMRVSRHTIDSFRETLLPKMHGTIHLYELINKVQLEFFMMFSSHNAIIGAERESNYSSANAFLDSFAAKIKRQGIQGITVRWAFWSETGMGYRMHQYDGLTVASEISLTNEEGIRIVDTILQNGYTNVLITKKDPSELGPNPFFISYGTPIVPTSLFSVATTNSLSKQLDPLTNTHPEESLEELVSQVWKAVLGKENIHRDDNFFQLGGHSLLGIQVRNQVEKRLKIKLEYRDLVEHPTVKSLAAYIKGIETIPSKAFTRISPVAVRELYPLSEAQLGLWIAFHTEEKKSLYNVSVGYTIRNHSLNREAFRAAVQYMIGRHEVFRTKFINVDGQVFQSVVSADDVVIPVEYHVEGIENNLQNWLSFIGNYSFDLQSVPLFRIWIIEQPPNQYQLLIAVHHIIVDGWSMHLFLHELLGAYVSFSNGHKPERLPLQIQYKDYAVWEQERLSLTFLDQHKIFWSTYLHQLPATLNLPIDFQRKPLRSGQGNIFCFHFEPIHLKGFRQISDREGVSMFIIGASIVQLLLYRYTGQEDFLIGTPSSLRIIEELESQIGYYVNMLPLRCRLNGTDTFYSVLSRTNNLLKDIQDNQYYPLSRIIQDLGILKEPGRNYLFDTIFSYEYQSAIQNAPTNFNGDVIELGNTITNSRYDLEFTFKEVAGTLTGNITYDTNLFQESTIREITQHLIYLADLITMNVPVSRIYFEEGNQKADQYSGMNFVFDL